MLLVQFRQNMLLIRGRKLAGGGKIVRILPLSIKEKFKFIIVKSVCIQWHSMKSSGYSDIFPNSQGCQTVSVSEYVVCISNYLDAT